MLIPEIILNNILNTFLKYAKDDYAAEVDKTKTILYTIFKKDDNGDDIVLTVTDDWYRRAVAMFTKTGEQQRLIQVYIGYNMTEAGSPSMHILLPSDSKGRFNAIGNVDNEDNTMDDIYVYINKVKTKSVCYNIMLTSDNSIEVVVMYHFLTAMFLMFYENLEFLGLRNVQENGADIIFQDSLVPVHIFHRNFTLQFDFEYKVQFKTPIERVGKINFNFCTDLATDLQEKQKELQ